MNSNPRRTDVDDRSRNSPGRADAWTDHKTVPMPAVETTCDGEELASENSDRGHLFEEMRELSSLGDEHTESERDTLVGSLLDEMQQALEWSEAKRQAQQDDVERLRTALRSSEDALASAEEAFKETAARLKKNLEKGSESVLINLLTELMPVADETKRAMMEVKTSNEPEKIVRAVRKVDRGLALALASVGFCPYSARVEPHDSELHEVVEEVICDTQLPGTILNVYRPGYVFRGRVLRRAQVAVASRSTK